MDPSATAQSVQYEQETKVIKPIGKLLVAGLLGTFLAVIIANIVVATINPTGWIAFVIGYIIGVVSVNTAILLLMGWIAD